MNNIKNTFRAGLTVAAGIVAMCACTDTWNDHYDTAPQLKFNGSAMQALEEKAPEFAKVVKAYGFDKELSSSNTYTVWAPADGTFTLSDYIDDNGERVQDSAEVVNEFIKNHVARYLWTLSSEDQTFNLMNKKIGTMTADGKFCVTDIDADPENCNVACTNGILYIIDSPNPFSVNLLEKIRDLYRLDDNEGKEDCSLYSFLYNSVNNADTLIESKSVNRGVDENGDKIWVYKYLEPNNTVLKNVDARLYEEDSSFIAIIPTARAWQERYKEAEKLLVFNPSLDKDLDEDSPSICDSLTRHYANYFSLTDLFYNKNANEHLEDSLKSTNYTRWKWYEHVYYRTMPEELPEFTEVNDILAKCGDPMECSNGTAYEVDEYPFSIYEQFFKPIKTNFANGTINKLTDSSGKTPLYTTNLPNTIYNRSGTWTWTNNWYADEEMTELVYSETRRNTYSYAICTPNAAGDIQVALNVENTLSGTYDLYVVTCPIWMKEFYTDQPEEEMNLRGYRFTAAVMERNNDPADKDHVGQFPENTTTDMLMTNPDPVEEDATIFTTPVNRFKGEDYFPVVNDTIYLGQWTFKNAYFGRPDNGAMIIIRSQVPLEHRNNYSVEMLLNKVILKPHDPSNAVEVKRHEGPKVAAPQRKNYKLITSNTHN